MKQPRMVRNTLPATLALLVILLAVGAARADIATYTAVLSGDNEVPPVVTAAGGVATLMVDTATHQATWTLDFADLSTAQTGAHVHAAPAGINGGVVFAFPLGAPVNGAWAMAPADYDALVNDGLYVNVHTELHPGGEIRGQFILSDVVGTEDLALGSVKAMYR